MYIWQKSTSHLTHSCLILPVNMKCHHLSYSGMNGLNIGSPLNPETTRYGCSKDWVWHGISSSSHSSSNFHNERTTDRFTHHSIWGKKSTKWRLGVISLMCTLLQIGDLYHRLLNNQSCMRPWKTFGCLRVYLCYVPFEAHNEHGNLIVLLLLS